MPIPFPFIPQLLAKALIKRGATSSVAAVMAFAERQYDHSAYIIKVLEAPIGTRVAVKAMAMERMAAVETNTSGQERVVCILTMFEILSPAQKVDFIEAYKACATTAGQGPISVVLQNTWQNNHNPPYYEP